MVTYNKILFDIKETLSSNQVIDDFNIDERRIMYIFNNQRSLWLKREYNTPGRRFNSSIVQSFCIDLEVQSSDICPCDNFYECDEFLVSKTTLPVFLELHHKPAIIKVGSPDLKALFFSPVPYAQSVYSGSGRFNQNSLFVFFIENKLYIPIKKKEHKLISRLNIMGIFEDPTELSKFKNCSGEVCFDKDSQYPINAGMIPFIKDMVVKELLMSYQLPKDDINDANFNPGLNNIKQ